MNHTLNSILAAAKRAGLAHNGGAGGEHLLCASGAQLLAFATAIAEPPAPALPEDIEAIVACLGDDAAALRHDTSNTEDERAANMDAAASLLENLAQRLQLPVAAPFQARVQPWLLECFGTMIAGDREERNHRFLEEALELVQACGCSASEAHQLVDYVYGRPVGQPEQEVGGVMVTLAALCLANRMDMHLAAENELARIWTMVEKIRAKQAAKPKHSPLPQAALAQPSAPAVAWRERMGPRAAWTPCSKEHHDWVLRAPAEWPGVEVQALAVAGPYVPFKALQAAFAMRSPTCWCESCDAAANAGHRSRMSLCPSCGDKHCPRSLHHEHDCQFGAAHGQPT